MHHEFQLVLLFAPSPALLTMSRLVVYHVSSSGQVVLSKGTRVAIGNNTIANSI
jgi:hypothetical protein